MTMDSASKGLHRDVGVVIAAAGSGSRFGEKKQFLLLGGKPLLLHSLETFLHVAEVAEIAIVAPAEDAGRVGELARVCQRAGAVAGGPYPRVRVVAGGARRQDSVERGLEALGPACRWALVHDAARPLIRVEEVERLIAVLRQRGAAVIGHPATDSVKEEKDGLILRNLPRQRVWLVQTPQAAAVEALRRAAAEARRRGVEGTDEASLLELAGVPVALVEGSRDNIKVTYPEDLALAEFLLSRREQG
ncbi:MAG: 2-C-methyl-D-erythritol 4-phosphate cytidylyltransferase [Planctomycetes bacterium]|nr:2-C-methyl-D-erythritol 4-phosphate cytidylyltransferase [Planctomycetota bacterium]